MQNEQAPNISQAAPRTLLLQQRNQHASQPQLVGVHAQRVSCLCSICSMALLAKCGIPQPGAGKPEPADCHQINRITRRPLYRFIIMPSAS